MMRLDAFMERMKTRLALDEDGSALIEGAIIIPVLCVILFGIYEFSWYFYQRHVISTGLRDAARYAARLPSACNRSSPEWPAIQAFAKNLATTGSIDGGAARVSGWTSAAVRLDCSGIENTTEAAGVRAYRGGPTVYIMTASTRFREPTLGLLGFLGLPAPTISVSHSERVIGPG
jgi:Flp pilus assembly protein TadG